ATTTIWQWITTAISTHGEIIHPDNWATEALEAIRRLPTWYGVCTTTEPNRSRLRAAAFTASFSPATAPGRGEGTTLVSSATIQRSIAERQSTSKCGERVFRLAAITACGLAAHT